MVYVNGRLDYPSDGRFCLSDIHPDFSQDPPNSRAVALLAGGWLPGRVTGGTAVWGQFYKCKEVYSIPTWQRWLPVLDLSQVDWLNKHTGDYEMKVHFLPKRKFHKRAYKGVCGQKWVEITYKTDLVTCERCKQSPAYKAAKEQEESEQASCS